jgi:hypothetical protein
LKEDVIEAFLYKGVVFVLGEKGAKGE